MAWRGQRRFQTIHVFRLTRSANVDRVISVLWSMRLRMALGNNVPDEVGMQDQWSGGAHLLYRVGNRRLPRRWRAAVLRRWRVKRCDCSIFLSNVNMVSGMIWASLQTGRHLPMRSAVLAKSIMGS